MDKTNLIGDWKVKKVLSFGDDGMKYIPVEEAIEKDPENSQMAANMILRFADDGKYYTMCAIPEGADIEEVREHVSKNGGAIIDDRYFADKPKKWKEIDGVVKYDSGEHGTIFDQPVDPWKEFSFDEEGLLTFMAMFKFEKVEE